MYMHSIYMYIQGIDMYIYCLYCNVVADIFKPGLLSTGYYPGHPSLPLLHWGGSPRCPLGRLLVCSPPAAVYLLPSSKTWKSPEESNLQILPWVVCQLRRVVTGRMLLKRYGLSAELRLASITRLIGPDWKWSVVVNKVHTSTYCVCTLYIRVCTCIYHVRVETVILEGI